MKRRGLWLILGAVLLGGLAVGGREFIKRAATDQLQARVAARGLSVRWASRTLSWTGRLYLTEVAISGPGVAVHAHHLVVVPGLDGLRPVPRRVAVEGVRGSLRLKHGARRGNSSKGAAFSGLDVLITDAEVEIEGWATVQVAQLQRVGGRISGRGSLEPRCCGLAGRYEAKITGDMSGITARPIHGRFEASVQGVEVSAGAVQARRSPEGWWLEAQALNARRGERLKLTDATARWRPGEPIEVVGGHAQVQLTPSAGRTASAAQAPTKLPPPVRIRYLTVTLDGPIGPIQVQSGHWLGDALIAQGTLGGGRFDLYAGDLIGLRPSTVALTLQAASVEALGAGGRLDLSLFATAAGPLGGAWPTAVIADLAVGGGHLDARYLGEDLDRLNGFARFGVRSEPGQLMVDHLVAGHGALVVRAEGAWHDGALGGAAQVQAAVDSVDCQAALDAIPASLLGPYTGLKAAGTFAPTLRLDLPIGRPTEVKIKAKGWTRRCTITQMAGSRRPSPHITVAGKPADLSDVTWLNEPFVFNVTTGVDQGRTVKVGPGVRGYVALGRLPGYVGAAAYLTEEMNFWKGGAYSPHLLARALATNLGTGRHTYGGSTITQQLVKNLVLDRHKTLLRKLREIFVAARVTDAVSKARILELYLNCIEFGPNLFGVGRASHYYFQKDPAALTVKEAIFLAMLKPAPRRGASYKRRGHEPDFPWWRGRVVQVASRLRDAGLISSGQWTEAIEGRLTWVDGQYVGSSAEAARAPSPASE